MQPKTREELAGVIDHTLLSPSAVRADVERVCDEAIRFGFATVCIGPRWVELVADRLHGHGPAVCSVVGFSLGNELTKVKALQAEKLIMAGVDEVDMLADLAAILEGDERYLAREVRDVLTVCRSMRPAVPLKVIIESAALTDDRIAFACRIIEAVGADFIKTSTGFHPAGGARAEHVRLMARSAPNCRIKAAGGIRTAEQAVEMLAAGASRLGASASVRIVEGFAAPSTQ